MITCNFENQNKVLLRHVVVDNLVTKDNQILLVKRGSKYLEPYKWALPGGYVERDETVKKAAKREVFEETGYQTKVIDLFQIIDNPDRKNEDRQNISFVHLLKPLKKIKEPDHEIKQAKWFNLNNLPNSKEIAFDHLDMINNYKKYLQKPFKLPLLK